MFCDQVTLILRAGKGGNGVIAWRREKFLPKGGPAGGNGGKGGSIFLKADPQLSSLENFCNQRIFSAESGQPGGSKQMDGKNGEDLLLKIPPGTIVRDKQTREILIDFTDISTPWKVCEGGQGGKGNTEWKSPTHQAPFICTEGAAGDVREVELELKLIADVGLIGMPNAGKSSLLCKLTHAKTKVASYPFTTLHPNLGLLEGETFSRIVLADIPGILQGAHLNKGLGLAFLRHIERTALLLFVLDGSTQEGRDPFDDFSILREELAAHNPSLLQKPFLVALNKIDLPEAQEALHCFRKRYPFPQETLFEISALTGEGLSHLVQHLKNLHKPVR